MTRQYKAAIVGCGTIGQAHMEGYERLDNVDVVAVVDQLEPARKMYMDQYGIPQGYTTVAEMLDKARPDIVSVCVWHLLHDTMTAQIAVGTSVKGIICEKPMAIGMGKADAMVEVCESNKVKLAIAHQRRFTPGWERARELVASGAIGIPLRADLRINEGLANNGTHSIDGARYVLGDPAAEWVMAAVERRTNRYERDTAIEDACIGLIHFGGSLQFFIQSDLWDRNCHGGKFFIRGTEGMLHITERVLKLFNSETEGWKSVDLTLKEGDKPIGGNTNAKQLKELIAWIEGGPESRGSGRIARDTVEIMMAMYESARHNEVIRLPLQEKEYPLEFMINEGKLPLVDTERYDIRGFLDRSRIDEDRFQQLRDDGILYTEAMRILHKEMGTPGIRPDPEII